MKTGLKLFILVTLGVVIAVAAAAQQPGELWRQKTTIEMEGMGGMKMPAQTTEICVPTGKDPDATTMMQQMQKEQKNPDNCQLANFKQSGNKTSGDLKCTGKDAMEAHFEMEIVGDTSRGTVTMKTKDGTVTVKTETTKTGKSCVDKSADIAKQAEQMNKQMEQAEKQMEMMKDQFGCSGLFKSAGDNLASQAELFVGLTSKLMAEDCTKDASFQQFCSNIQTSPKGFIALEEKSLLSDSLKVCGLSEATVRPKLLPHAEKEGVWKYLLLYGTDEYYPKLVEIVKKECAGRSFTSEVSPKYRELCQEYGWEILRGNRRSVLRNAGCTEELERSGRGMCAGYSASRDADAEPERPGSNAGSGVDAKPKSAIDLGRQKIRGLLGR